MGKPRKSNKYLPRRMYLKSGRYYLVTVDNKWISLSKNYSEAMAEYGKLTDHSSKVCRTVSELIDRYIAEISPTRSKNTHMGNMQCAKFLKAGLGSNPIRLLTPDVIENYLEARSNSPYSANRELVVLSLCYAKAIKWRYATVNPCIGVDKFPEEPRDYYITDSDFNAFKSFVDDKTAAYMDFKYLTGLRTCDILNIKLDQIRVDCIYRVEVLKVMRGKSIIGAKKRKKFITFEMTPKLKEVVDRIKGLKRRVGGKHLFITRSGTAYTPRGFSCNFRKKMHKAVESGVLKTKFQEHDIRAKTASDTTLEHATKLLGHSDQKVTKRHYRRKDEIVKPLM